MAVQNRSNLINHSYKVLKKHYVPVPPPQGRNVLEHLLYGICLEGTSYEVADRAFERIRAVSFDWNEIRVTSIAELSESFKGAPHPTASAANLKRALHSVFETQYSYDLDGLTKQNLGKAIKDLSKHPGATPFAVSYLTQHGLGGHSIPLDDGTIELMFIVGIIDEKEKNKNLVPGLERTIPKAKGIEYGSLLHQLAAEFVASPLSPKIRAILLELNPDCKDRLPKRKTKKRAVEEKPKTEPKAKKAANAKAPAGKTAAKKPEKKAARQTDKKDWRKNRQEDHLQEKRREEKRREENRLKANHSQETEVIAGAAAPDSYGAVNVMRRRTTLGLMIALSLLGLWSPAAGDEPRRAHDGIEVLSDLSTRDGQSQPGAESATSRSLALFAHGHLLKRHGQYAEALSAFQRGWFWHPRHRKVLDEVVALAFMLDRNESAIQYAVLAAEIEPRDPHLLRQLGGILTQRGEYARAVRLFKSGLALVDRDTSDALNDEQREAIRQQLQSDIAKTCFLGDLADDGVAATEATIRGLRARLDDSLDDAINESIREDLALYFKMLGEFQRQRSAVKLAFEAFREAYELDQNESIWLYWQARLAFDQGRVAEARGLLDEYLELAPREGGLAALELVSEVHAQDRAALCQRLEAKFASEPADRALGFHLAQCYLEDNQTEAARGVYEAMFSDRPTLDTYRGLLRCQRLLRDPAAAIALLGQLVESELDLVSVDDEVAQMAGDGPFLDSIIGAGLARQQDEARPLLAREAYAIAVLLAEATHWDHANRFVDFALGQAKEPRRHDLVSAWALECLVRDQFASAARAFERSLASSTDAAITAERKLYLATALALAGQTDKALATIDEAVASEPESITLANRRAWILRNAKRIDEAMTAYQEIVQQFASSEASDELQSARLVLATLAADRRDVQLAETHLMDVLAHDPENYGAMNDLGYLWADHGMHLIRAKQLIEVAVAREPDNPAYRDSQGWVHFKLGNLDQALVNLQSASLESDPPDGIIFEHLGDTHAALGRNEDARKAWKDSINAFRQAGHLHRISEVAEKIGELGTTDTADVD